MTPPVCVSFTAEKLTDIQKGIPSYISVDDVVEVYVDYLSDDELPKLPAFIEGLKAKCIVTTRRPRFAEQRRNFSARTSVLSTLSGSSCIIDLDINNEIQEIKHVLGTNFSGSLMTSYHNYTETPHTSELETIYRKMSEYSPAIYKFACACIKDEDCVNLLSFLTTLQADNRMYVVTGMQERGKVVRLAGALHGNAWNYVARTNGPSTADGQFTYEQFKLLVDL